MKITDIRVRVRRNQETAGNVKAFVSITIDDAFAVHDLKVIETNGTTFVAMPSRKITAQDRYVDVAHPINQETREMIQSAVMAAYEEALQNPEAEDVGEAVEE